MVSSMSIEARRGEVWMLDLGEPVGDEQGWQRPALIVSSDEWNRYANVVTVLPITRTKHDFPMRVEIDSNAGTGLRETSYARCEDIRTVSGRRLVRRIGAVDMVTMSALGRCFAPSSSSELLPVISMKLRLRLRWGIMLFYRFRDGILGNITYLGYQRPGAIRCCWTVTDRTTLFR